MVDAGVFSHMRGLRVGGGRGEGSGIGAMLNVEEEEQGDGGGGDQRADDDSRAILEGLGCGDVGP